MLRYWLHIIAYLTFCFTSLPAQIPVSGYSQYNLSGFNVLIEQNAFIYDKVITRKAIKLMEEKLEEISKLGIRQSKIDLLKRVPIFVDWNTTNGGAQYHPSKSWLKRNGYATEKAGCVEISNINHFVQWSRLNQPEMVLHELAHAYHHRLEDSLKTFISEAYLHALTSKKYIDVLYHPGKGKSRVIKNAYALNDEREYFSELSEAYFGMNDYYPFDRQDLEEYDTLGFKMMETIWGKFQQ